jgi:predicted site-specific integrase-resolvase
MKDEDVGDILDGLMSANDLAKELNVSIRTLSRWHVAGTGPTRVKLGKKTYYRKDSVHAWIESKEK